MPVKCLTNFYLNGLMFNQLYGQKAGQ